ncbi:MAG: ABC transporter ATP-binding protein [Prevotellaceae bacterium]|jgi:ABC-2 type transport system ATP-binding protein|nr:ABC transporter ATP-binding protein [Prevotellaceae bacterium]
MDVINIINLKKAYNKVIVVDIPLLNINQGEIVGVAGNNGAGKTTMFRLMIDLIKADSGNVYSRGMDVSKDEKWKTYTSAYLDTNFLIDFLTPEEYFVFIAECYGKDVTVSKQKISEFDRLMNNEILNQKKYIRDFSSGNRQKIGIIGAVLPEPEILILDEPFNYLDPSSQIRMKNLLQEYNQKYGTTIILSSHNIQHVTDICNRIIVLESGRIIMNETHPDETFHRELQGYFQNQG